MLTPSVIYDIYKDKKDLTAILYNNCYYYRPGFSNDAAFRRGGWRQRGWRNFVRRVETRLHSGPSHRFLRPRCARTCLRRAPSPCPRPGVDRSAGGCSLPSPPAPLSAALLRDSPVARQALLQYPLQKFFRGEHRYVGVGRKVLLVAGDYYVTVHLGAGYLHGIFVIRVPAIVHIGINV